MTAFILFPILVFSSAFANPASHTLTRSELQDKLKYYKKINTLHTKFKQVKNLKDLGMELESSGELSLVFPEEVTWTLLTPAYTQLKLSGQTLSLESGELANRKKNTFNLTKELGADISKSLLHLLVWLKIDVDSIFQLYEVVELGTNSYSCKPRNTQDAVFEGLNFVIHPKGHISKLILSEKSGDHLTISFSDPKVHLKK